MLLGICRQQLADNHRAEAAFSEVVRRTPQDPQPRFYLALVRMSMGKYAEAATDALASLDLGGDPTRAHHLLGMISEEQNELEKALAAYQSALKAGGSGSPDMQLSTGTVLLKLGRPSEAVKHFDAAVELNPKLPEAHYHRGRAYLEVGRQAEAVKSLEAAVRLGGHRQAKSLLERVRSMTPEPKKPEPEKPEPKKEATKKAGSIAPIRFLNAATEAGLDFVLENHPTGRKYLVETMAGGVAAFDYDNDGRTDIFFTNGADTPSLEKSAAKFHNRLYRNQGGMKFADVTEKARVRGEGYSIGAAAGDYDNDGNVDLFVAGVGGNILYRNTGEGGFEDVTTQAGIKSTKWSVAAGWFDHDRDGLLDLFVVNYLDWSPDTDVSCKDESTEIRTYCHPKYYDGLPNQLYRNQGDGTFQDISATSGIGSHVGKGMSLAFADYDGDGRTDVFVTNDAVPNFLFRNLGEGRFVETGLEAGVALKDDGVAVSSMGADFSDYDNDGRPDILFTALPGETFPVFRNEGGLFRDSTYASKIGVLSGRLGGWGVGLADFNNDGWKDVFTANAHVTDNIDEFTTEKYRQPNAVWANAGDGTFRDESASSGDAFRAPRAHRGAAFADFDNDGKIDVVVTALGELVELWRNVSPDEHHWIRLVLEGRRSNRDGMGAVVRVGDQHNQMTAAVGYASSSHAGVHFGLGTSASIPRVEIQWPSSVRQVLEDVRADQVLTVHEPE